jgi:hypothetical protein
MALEGTLRDFSLADILQLISLQRKTGLLTLKSQDDVVTLGFEEGLLVSAESSARRMDTRLGTLLVKTRSLTAEQLARALEIQSQTLQRLGFILLKNGFCTTEELRAGLDIQIKKIAYGLFRWTDGDYIFAQAEKVDYDHEFGTPVAVESLLMEGMRMLDEWPIIEKVIRSPELIYQRIAVGQDVVPADVEDELDLAESTLDKKSYSYAKKDESIKISRPEWAVYELVDGRRSVNEILERTFLSEFDGTKAFFDLVTRGLIEEAKPTNYLEGGRSKTLEIPAPRVVSLPSLATGAVVLLLLALGLFFQSRNPLNLVTVPGRRIPILESYQKSVSLFRLRRLSEAVDIFYLTQGKFPESTAAIVGAQLLSTSDLVDPWGNRYQYILNAELGKYLLAGYEPDGRTTDADLLFSHQVQKTGSSSDDQAKTRSGKEVIILK